MSKKTFFQDHWLYEPAFNSWLEKVNNDLRLFQCKFCKSQNSLSNMGKRAIISHMEGKKHKNLPSNCILKMVKNIFFQPPRTKDNNSNNSIEQSRSLVILTVTNSEIITVEINWAFNCIYNNFSLSSCDDMKSLFTNMFPDSNVANSFSMLKDKLSYVINFGIAPYITDMLIENIKQSTIFSIGFDESFNETLQKCQMYFVVRYWDNVKSEVSVRYLNSKFLGHATALDITHEFNEDIKELNKAQLLQISMAGPSVN